MAIGKYSRQNSFTTKEEKGEDWEPYATLEITNPETRSVTCVGYAPSCGRRCQKHINKCNREAAFAMLDTMTLLSLSSSKIASLLPIIASLCLCSLHKDKVETVSTQWQAKISSLRRSEIRSNSWRTNNKPDSSGTRSKANRATKPTPEPTKHRNGGRAWTSWESNRSRASDKWSYYDDNEEEEEEDRKPKFRVHIKKEELSDGESGNEESIEEKSSEDESGEDSSDEEAERRYNKWKLEREERIRREKKKEKIWRRKWEREEQERKEQKRREKEREKQEREEQERMEQERREQERKEQEKRDRAAQNERIRLAAQKKRDELDRQVRERIAKEKKEWDEAWITFSTRWTTFREIKILPVTKSSIPWPVKSGCYADLCASKVRDFYNNACPAAASPALMYKAMQVESLKWHSDKAAVLFPGFTVGAAEREVLRMICCVVLELRREANLKRGATPS